MRTVSPGSVFLASAAALCACNVPSSSNITREPTPAADAQVVRGSGVRATQVRSVAEFHSLRIEQPCELALPETATTSISLTADDNLIDEILTEVRDGVLVISTRNPARLGFTVGPLARITPDLAVPLLVSAEPDYGPTWKVGTKLNVSLGFDEPIRAVNVDGAEYPATDGSDRVEIAVDVPPGDGPWSIEGSVRDTAGNSGPFSASLVRPDGKGRAPEGWTIVDASVGFGGWSKRVQEPRSGIVFVLIPPGEFTMGSPATEIGRDGDENAHRVRLTRPFYLAECETTQGQYAKVTTNTPSKFSGEDRPVESVSWSEALRFCEAIQCELPTEAQWEYACRAGGKSSAYSSGSDLGRKLANFNGDSPFDIARDGGKGRETSDVKSLAPNEWGLYDMHGNVLEWCQDGYSPYISAAPRIDPFVPPEPKRVVRGGGWMSAKKDCRSANRDSDASDARDSSQGFRCARSLP